MLELQKIFLLVRFFSLISCNKCLKAKISHFVFFCLTPWDWNIWEAERPLCSWPHIYWRNTKICIYEASQMEQKCGKCWKLPIFEGKLQVFISYLSEMKIVSMFYNFFILVLFTACFYHFLFWKYLNSSMRRFSIWTAVSFQQLFPKGEDLPSRERMSSHFGKIIPLPSEDTKFKLLLCMLLVFCASRNTSFNDNNHILKFFTEGFENLLSSFFLILKICYQVPWNRVTLISGVTLIDRVPLSKMLQYWSRSIF